MVQGNAVGLSGLGLHWPAFVGEFTHELLVIFW